jgi:hypothetical protein
MTNICSIFEVEDMATKICPFLSGDELYNLAKVSQKGYRFVLTFCNHENVSKAKNCLSLFKKVFCTAKFEDNIMAFLATISLNDAQKIYADWVRNIFLLIMSRNNPLIWDLIDKFEVNMLGTIEHRNLKYQRSLVYRELLSLVEDRRKLDILEKAASEKIAKICGKTIFIKFEMLKELMSFYDKPLAELLYPSTDQQKKIDMLQKKIDILFDKGCREEVQKFLSTREDDFKDYIS